MELTINESTLQRKEPLRRTATQTNRKKTQKHGLETKEANGALNEVHRKLPNSSMIYSDYVGLNNEWSEGEDEEVSSEGEEELESIEEGQDVIKKRANSADLDKNEEEGTEGFKAKDAKKKMVTSAV
jgi:hypothetical protein